MRALYRDYGTLAELAAYEPALVDVVCPECETQYLAPADAAGPCGLCQPETCPCCERADCPDWQRCCERAQDDGGRAA